MTPELLRERLTQVNGDRMALAEDLFGVADFLRTHSSVQRALTDPARSQTDKDSLIDRLFGPVVGEVSLQCLHDLGQGHWSRPRDIVLKIEDAGCDAVLLNAQLDGVLEETEAQLVAIAVFLQSHRDLRNELSNLSALSPKGRADLAQRVFGDVVNRPTMRLLRRSVGRASHGHLLEKLRGLAARAAELSGRRFVFVESAQELRDDQKNRLEKILEKKLGSPVSATYTLRPDLLGGLVVRMGTERVDASLATRVGALKRSIVG